MKIRYQFLSFAVCAIYGAAAFATTWTYAGDTSPAFWGKLDESYDMCEKGVNQSPVNITQGYDVTLPELKFHYVKSDLKLINKGHTIVADLDTENTLELNGEIYKLVQFHIHTPSEHALNNKTYPLEIHFVHENQDNHLLIVGLFFEIGKNGTVISKLYKQAPKQPGMDKEIWSFDIKSLLPLKLDYFTYNGSLTTPPCTEGVRWIVLKEALQIKEKELVNLKVFLNENNRPVQDMNARFLME